MLSLLLLSLPLSTAPIAAPPLGERLFMRNARLIGEEAVVLPTYHGLSNGRDVMFIVTEASDGDWADAFGVAVAQKLENARGTRAVMKVTLAADGTVHFPATVDFSPERIVVGDPEFGFPPLEVAPGAIGEEGYSPLIELPDGTILNAPHLENASGVHDSVLRIGQRKRYARLELVPGFARDKPVLYISTEASSPVAAALEGATYAPALNAAPGLGDDSSHSSRASLAALTNGPTGVGNPERQGLNSALLGEGPPRNILAWLPNQGRYSPLWDVHLTQFAPGVRPRLIEEFAEAEDLAEEREVTAPDGSRWGASDFIVNCPIVMRVD